MRVAFLIGFNFVLLAFALDSYSQQTKISLDMKSAKVEDVIDQIEKTTEYFFMYNKRLIDADRVVDIKLVDKSVSEVLNKLFANTDVTYSIIDRQILLINNRMLGSGTNYSNQLQNYVSGKVTDTSGSPMTGVTVRLAGTMLAVITDINGNYTIHDTPSKTTLQFSYIGKKTKEVDVYNKSTCNIILEDETYSVNEVVATGYGTRKKASITGSISTVRGDDLNKTPTTNLANSLAGRLTGLMIRNFGDEPGSVDKTQFRIRGNNTIGDNGALIVVDGIANRDLIRINPSDIESVSVLKDASAAIYGAQAANGVILITTKRGKIGKPTVTLNLNVGFNQPTRLPELCNAAEYATVRNEQNIFNGSPPKWTDAEIQKFRDGSDPLLYPNTDWTKQVLNPRAPQNSASINLSGGTDNIKYYLSAGTNYQGAIYKNSGADYRQYNIRSNLDAKVTKNFSIGFDIVGRQQETNTVLDAWWRIMEQKPTNLAYWPEGEMVYNWKDGIDVNPAATVSHAQGYNLTKRYILETNLKMNVVVPWVKGLSLSSNVSYDKNNSNQKVWNTPYYLYRWDGMTTNASGNPSLTQVKIGTDPSLSVNYSDYYSFTANLLINYEVIIASTHSIKVMLGSERNQTDNQWISASRDKYFSAALSQIDFGVDENKNNGGNESTGARLNYFGRFNYDFRNKYLTEFVFRYDGSYKFAKPYQYGFFPGISLGYRISEEEFWKENISYINNFKFRASWGQTGNDRIADYQFTSTYKPGDVKSVYDNSKYIFNGYEKPLLQEVQVANKKVTWELATQSNFGIDVAFFDYKLTFEADYFHNNRTNILISRTGLVPETSGLNLPQENAGIVKSHGFEGSITYQNSRQEYKYSASINGSWAKNEIVKWFSTPNIPDYQSVEGHSMPQFYWWDFWELFYQADGIYKNQAQIDAGPKYEIGIPKPGDIIYKDVNKDGKITPDDRVRGNKSDIPTFIGGLNLTLSYKWFDLDALFQGAAGAKRYLRLPGTNLLKEWYDNRWTPENPDGTWPRVPAGNPYWSNTWDGRNTFFLKNNNYLRFKSLEIGFNVSKKWSKAMKNKDLRVYVQGLNLFTIDNYHFFDPEADDTYSSATSYPVNKVYSLGLTLTF